jgi:hypothetical protein
MSELWGASVGTVLRYAFGTLDGVLEARVYA